MRIEISASRFRQPSPLTALLPVQLVNRPPSSTPCAVAADNRCSDYSAQACGGRRALTRGCCGWCARRRPRRSGSAAAPSRRSTMARTVSGSWPSRPPSTTTGASWLCDELVSMFALRGHAHSRRLPVSPQSTLCSGLRPGGFAQAATSVSCCSSADALCMVGRFFSYCSLTSCMQTVAGSCAAGRTCWRRRGPRRARRRRR